MKSIKHYFRAGFLIVGGLLFFFLVRAFLLPKSFGQYGFYRGDNVEEQMSHPVKFVPKDVCSNCHPDIFNQHQKGKHSQVQCESCHDVLSVHVDFEKGEIVGPMPIQKTSHLCLRCHEKLSSRPKEFPQITPEEHLMGNPKAHDPEVCFVCHSPHDPAKRKGFKK